MKLLVVYASRYGQTEKIARRIADVADAAGMECTVAPVTKAPPLHEFNDVVVAGPIYFGRHLGKMRRWVQRNRRALEERHTALVTVCGDVALGPEFVDKFVRESGWQPDVVATFGGAVRYSRYGWLVRIIMRSASRRNGRPTEGDHELTDWNAVDELARAFVAEGQRRAGKSACPPPRPSYGVLTTSTSSMNSLLP